MNEILDKINEKDSILESDPLNCELKDSRLDFILVSSNEQVREGIGVSKNNKISTKC